MTGGYSLPPCGPACHECRIYGVEHEARRVTPYDGVLHGRALRRWLDARDAFQASARTAVGPRGRRATGFERLAQGGPMDPQQTPTNLERETPIPPLSPETNSGGDDSGDQSGGARRRIDQTPNDGDQGDDDALVSKR